MLWFLFIVGSSFILMGLFVLISDPENSIMALLTIVFFGLCTLMTGWMLLRKDKINRSSTSLK
jgi:hypothetical protein